MSRSWATSVTTNRNWSSYCFLCYGFGWNVDTDFYLISTYADIQPSTFTIQQTAASDTWHSHIAFIHTPPPTVRPKYNSQEGVCEEHYIKVINLLRSPWEFFPLCLGEKGNEQDSLVLLSALCNNVCVHSAIFSGAVFWTEAKVFLRSPSLQRNRFWWWWPSGYPAVITRELMQLLLPWPLFRSVPQLCQTLPDGVIWATRWGWRRNQNSLGTARG